ncbi:MAG: LacI family transcriptional regulator [Spirochaetales bacterium]|nr:LacI family transcriptional regulator [Spirochaetales bacterium]
MSVSIKDVANKAGVSISTVSKALNDKSSVSSSTIERIKQTAEEMGYVPNSRARVFATKETKQIVFVADIPKDTAFYNPHIFEIIMGLQHSVSKSGYSLIVESVEKKEALEYISSLYKKNMADALVVHASIITKRLESLIVKSNLPHLIIGQPDYQSTLSWIDTDNTLSGAIAIRHLLKKDYYPVAFVGGKADDMISLHRFEGAERELKQNNLSFEEQYVLSTSSTIVSGMNAAKKILKMEKPPRSVLCANSVIAFGMMQELRNQKIKVPKDVAVMTFDRYPFSDFTEPRVTSVDMNMYEIGEEAGSILIKNLSHPNLRIQTFTSEPCIFEREST